MAGASSTRSSNGIPKVETPTAARMLSGAAAASRSRPAAIPRSKLARAPNSLPLSIVAEASRFPARSQAAAAILVPP